MALLPGGETLTGDRIPRTPSEEETGLLPRRSLVTAALVAAVASAPPATAAERGFPDLRMVQAAGMVSPYEARTGRCPDGMQPVGGGFDLPEGHSVAATVPVAGAGWQVKARSDAGATEAFDMTWYAMCATPPPGYEIVKRTETAVPNGEARSVTCPSGKDMVATGAEAKGPGAELNASYIFLAASAQVYYSVASGTSHEADTVDLDVYAVCTDHDLTVWSTRLSEGDFDNGDGPTLACPNGSRAVSAGFNLGITTSHVTGSRPRATGGSDWKFTGTDPDRSQYYLLSGLVCAD
ncbi:hypothetical protein ACFOY4_32930 [Actinomadura syzygii]|uniref:Uncharacterized protein n=1 Tax=Actinomadura syzygii TaxID=1427538 RepID=A0A5D0UBZ8_9ACTN|nr:hypothetical protein [Actinomadura syzygii]TYC15113.1 hypothetical protein FXF65_13460 [Actinomadura syzygii]